MSVWLESTLAYTWTGNKKAEVQSVTVNKARKGADRWNSHYICYFVRQLALRKGI